MKTITMALASLAIMTNMSIAGGDTGKNIAEPLEPVVEIPQVDKLTGFYVGAGMVLLKNEDTFEGNGRQAGTGSQRTNDRDVDWNGATLLAGYEFNSYLAIEARYAFSIGDATIDQNGHKYDIDADMENVGIYLKPMYPIGDFTVYGLLGYGQTTLEYEGSEEQSDSGFQWGLGGSYNITNKVSLFADYTLYYDDENFDERADGWNDKFDAISFGLIYKF
ncbi:MAG: porin family protein [Sulfurovum sp.]|nr:porin family protein [Sulfurovum sp.]